MRLRVDPASPVPPSRQIVNGLLDALARGECKDGERLPSVRALAAQVRVNPNTVERAMREVQALGAAEGRPGAGVFVTRDGPRLARELRRRQTLKALRRALRAARRAGHRSARLRECVERWLGKTTLTATPEDIR